LGKKKAPGSVYYDVTWIGYLGAKVPEKYAKVFGVVREARDRAVDLIARILGQGSRCRLASGQAARGVIEKAGYEIFLHRTGHQHRREIHGNGANMDGLETHDVRHLIHGLAIRSNRNLLPDFGIRSEVNVVH